MIRLLLILSFLLPPPVFSHGSLCPERLAVESAAANATAKRLAVANAAAKQVVQESREALEALDTELQAAMACGDKLQCTVLRLKKAGHHVRRYVEPLFIGYKSETYDRVRDRLNSAFLTMESAETASAARGGFTYFLKEVVTTAGSEFKQSLQSVWGKHLLGNPIALVDFLRRWSTVISIQAFVMAMDYYALGGRVPLEIFLNTTLIMWMQSDVGAKKMFDSPAVVTPNKPVVAPAADSYELNERMPAMVAGDYGYSFETRDRFLGFASLWPVEIAILTVSKMAIAALTVGTGELAQGQAWQNAAWDSFSFVSLFGLYLAAKWSIVDKIVELRLLPQVQELVSRKYRAQWDRLAEQHGIPYEGADAWNGWMIRQRLDVAFPTAQAPDKPVSARDYLKHWLGLGFVSKYLEFRKDRRRFKEFLALPEVVALQGTPEAKATRKAQGLEMALYRLPSGLWDAWVAVWLMGSK